MYVRRCSMLNTLGLSLRNTNCYHMSKNLNGKRLNESQRCEIIAKLSKTLINWKFFAYLDGMCTYSCVLKWEVTSDDHS
jgi:hypothetical protein